MVAAVNQIALSEAPHGRGTVGSPTVRPNSRNVIPGQVPFSVDFRNLAPAGMIFIPCKDGISHNEIEDALPKHIEAGANVLLLAMMERAA